MPSETYPSAESIALMQALLARPDARADAHEAFRRAYPDAPPKMIDTAGLHVVDDGIWATVDWLAAIEEFLREPEKGLDHGVSSHLLYHLYNWHLFQALLPMGRHGLKDRLQDLRLFIEEENKNAALEQLDRLTEALSGDVQPPTTA